MLHAATRVFPACAGMFLRLRDIENLFGGFPRVRGDVPLDGVNSVTVTEFSPRARGCSGTQRIRLLQTQVFPACAGMFLTRGAEDTTRPGFPRVRGDVPQLGFPGRVDHQFSPRARGCSDGAESPPRLREVFPACAGMFPVSIANDRPTWCFPRVRGDVPTRTAHLLLRRKFSPRARGCSPRLRRPVRRAKVFPACAGMFLGRFPQSPE